jgi:hypothetical protein
MNEAQKRLKTQCRDQQRKAALAALPLPGAELKAMFDMLDTELPRRGCDHTRHLTRGWLESRGHDIDRVFAWLDTQGGFCDCEILGNVEEKVDDAAKAGA